MRGAVPLPARAESPADRLADLLAESATALSQDARSAARLAAEATALATAASEDQDRMLDQLGWMQTTDMAVVVSQAQNEVADFEAKDLDITPHRLRMRTQQH